MKMQLRKTDYNKISQIEWRKYNYNRKNIMYKLKRLNRAEGLSKIQQHSLPQFRDSQARKCHINKSDVYL